MSTASSIEWTDATWNPVTGCDRVSPGCAHCYALDLAARLKHMGQAAYQKDGDPKTSGPGFGVTLHPDRLEQPLRWRKPRMVFVNSMSDLFHEEIPYEYIRRVFNTMRSCDGGVTVANGQRRPSHTFQVLTKRPERMLELAQSRKLGFDPESPPPNVWFGVSIENRRFVHRADLLRETPAAVRFISAEPLLGPLVHEQGCLDDDGESYWYDGYDGSQLDFTGIDWLIVGGESGPEARRMDPMWVRDLRDATRCNFCEPDQGCGSCNGRGATTAFFFKQWGGRTPKAGGRELDGRTWDEFPGVGELVEVAA
jgi:protein gp37